jgi:3'-phosphoadenosine 5'-phosphosulfate sulfotransferase (PAPS reductase)/FAD synthetase
MQHSLADLQQMRCLPLELKVVKTQMRTIMKKKPAYIYAKTTGRYPIIATLTEESRLRTEKWLRHGCNAFEQHYPSSNPMSFWTEQDVLQYIVENKLSYASVYGDILQDANKQYYTTGASRTGCMFCMFGCHLEKPINRFQKLHDTHPKIYNYCINGGEVVDGVWQPSKEGLGIGKVLDYIGVNYKPVKQLKPIKLFEIK